MLRQGTRYKIPAGIGADVPVGNKTGETDDIENCQKVYPFDSGDSVS